MTALEPLTTPHKVKLTAADFLLLDKAGAFAAYAKSELIDGTIYVVNAQHRPHARVKSRLAFALERALSDGTKLEVLIEASIETGLGSVPEPDIVVTRDPDGEGFVPLASVCLAVEVADSSLAFDLGDKCQMYARLNVPEYWVADIRTRSIHQHWAPHDGGYAEKREIPFGDPIASATLAGVIIRSDHL